MKDNVDAIIENEKEWRRYMIKRMDKMEENFNTFKIKSFGFLTLLVTIAESIKVFLTHK